MVKPPTSRQLFRQELPWLVSEVVLLVILAYRIERFLASGDHSDS